MKLMKRGRALAFSGWIVVLLWMGLIFFLSAQPASHSNHLSQGVTKVVIETVEKVMAKQDLDLNHLNHIIRKNTHFFAYLVLGVFILAALHLSGIRGLRSYALAWGGAVLYAISDEVHQLYVPGRGAQASDVLIDSAGALTGILLYALICWLLRRRRKIGGRQR